MARARARARRSEEERSRRRFARRQWARRWLTLRYVAAALVLILVVGGGTWAVYFSDQLSVHDVEVVGARTVPAAQVAQAADVPLGGPLATLDLDAVQRRVESKLPVVRTVEVTRQWPDGVLITIQEREPVAVVEQGGGQLRAVDADGTVFGSFKRQPSGLPRIETASGPAIADRDALREAVTVIAALPSEVAVLVDHVDLRGVDEIDLVLRDGRLVRWGSADGSAEKAEVLLVLLSRPAEVYDVSVPAQPTTSDRTDQR
ncbi:cell division protein FtsQ/DivIB [Nocardioides litoris]|uniref:cell division protein FtsQ/DivIB n=1 Tax=Nocardioides litoris TaxID=1926648 RepID=UPI00111F2CB4|nr:FtsQ-type POTRA domain-containing protein [Nocardioides litoris]